MCQNPHVLTPDEFVTLSEFEGIALILDVADDACLLLREIPSVFVV
ncbi:MAG: hypothetical protein LBN05_08595 [Oscillospiraceae bacterium]|nr:hypothetical protein [Oscillospiraceae bacterium]